MKLKEVDEKIDIRTVKFYIPDTYKQELILAGLNTNAVYIHSYWSKGVWVIKNPGDTLIYPICIEPSLFLEFEVC